MNRIQKVLAGASIAGATLVGGALGATLVGTAGAQDSSSSTTAPSADATAPAQGQAPQGQGHQGRPHDGQAPDWSKGGHQANGKTEALLTGDDAAKATAAAQAAVPGATAQRVETDADGDAYEVHMTKSDGSVVTVKLDDGFTVTSTIDGMG